MHPAVNPHTYGIAPGHAETSERIKCGNNIRDAADNELPLERTGHKPADTGRKNRKRQGMPDKPDDKPGEKRLCMPDGKSQ